MPAQDVIDAVMADRQRHIRLDGLSQRTRHLLFWIADNARLIEAMDYGELVFSFGPAQVSPRITTHFPRAEVSREGG